MKHISPHVIFYGIGLLALFSAPFIGYWLHSLNAIAKYILLFILSVIVLAYEARYTFDK